MVSCGFKDLLVLSRDALVALGGTVVSVIAIEPKVRGFKPGRGNGYLRAIKIRSTPSSRRGSKAGGPMS
jgi:hypothetical protein